MPAPLARRLVAAPLVLLATSIAAFAVPRLTGRDTVRAVLTARYGPGYPADAEIIAQVRQRLGLDEPLVVRYAEWLSRVVRDDFGQSYVTGKPVGPDLLRSTGISVALIGVAVGLALVLGVPAGVAAARRTGGWLDRLVTGASRLGVAVPEYVLGPVLVIVFAVQLGVVPAAGWDGPINVILPAVTLAAYPTALFAQLARAETVDALEQPFIVTARAKGIGETRLLWVHAARTAMTGVIALSSLFLAGSIGAAVIVEVVFAVPGLGRLLLNAVLASDVPVIQGGLLVTVLVAMTLGLLADLAQQLADPVARLRERV